MAKHEIVSLGNRGKESDEQNHHPGKARIEQIGKGNLRRRPRAQFISGKIEDRLIGKEEKGE